MPVPPFPLTCDIWHGPAFFPPAGAPDIAGLPCALQQVWNEWTFITPPTASLNPPRYILMPALSDVRVQFGAGPDMIELPAGSGMFYLAYDVQDIRKGTADEYRRVLCNPLNYPNPVP